MKPTSQTKNSRQEAKRLWDILPRQPTTYVPPTRATSHLQQAVRGEFFQRERRPNGLRLGLVE